MTAKKVRMTPDELMRHAEFKLNHHVQNCAKCESGKSCSSRYRLVAKCRSLYRLFS